MTTPLPFHRYADLFPLMEGSELSGLVADIRTNGLRTPIVLFDDAILDGRNRYRACQAAGVSVRSEKYDGTDPLGFVISANLHRRHLDESQRAMVAAKLANMAEGRPRNTAPDGAVSQETAATMLNVGRRSVQRAAIVRDKGTAELIGRVERGEVRVSTAAKVAALPKPQQARLANASEPILRGAVKKARREERMVALAQATSVAAKDMSKGPFTVIYADPPWRFEPYNRDTGMDRAADNHYETMQLSDIKALKIPTADDAALFLWATAPMLPDALEVMASWGFRYRSHCIWAKDRIGTGYWFRNQHELLLVGTRGNIPAPAPGEQYASVIHAALEYHSVKPATFAEIIEAMFPNVPRLEMFARHPRLGWSVWGNEIREKDAA